MLSYRFMAMDMQGLQSGTTAVETAEVLKDFMMAPTAHFLKKYAAAAEKPIRAISTDALYVLTQRDFRGNVRELKNAVESAVLCETTDLLQPQSLPLHLTQEAAQATIGSLTDTSVILPLDEVERRAIVHAFKATDKV